VEQEDIAEIISLNLATCMGRSLLNGQAGEAKREIIAMMSQSDAQGMLPAGFRLMQATSTFAMYNHLTPGEWEDSHVRQARVWAKMNKGDIVLD
jgi:hypothetical protein